ncbi:MAG: orotate phosphoribosyltransferase [Methyloligellaceae bacterium]
MTDTGRIETSHIFTPSAERASERQRLFDIICQKSLISGEPITLTSGRISDYYFNTKPTMMDAEGSYLIASLMLDIIKSTPATLAGGLEMGAVPIAASISAVSHAQKRPVDAFFIRKQAKEHGTKSLIEGLPRNQDMSGKDVVVVEDVTTTGGSSIRAAQALQENGATVHTVITIIDRQEGAAEAFKDAGLNFTALFGGIEFRETK